MSKYHEELGRALDRSGRRLREAARQRDERVDDLLVELPLFEKEDKKLEVESFDELNSSGKQTVFGCMPTTTRPGIRGVTTKVCESCGQTVWMSPATQIAYNRIKNKVIICLPCIKAWTELQAAKQETPKFVEINWPF